MGRNIWSTCHECKVKLMHLRGEEGKTIHRFLKKHSDHEKRTELVNDYVEEPPESFYDVWDEYHDSRYRPTPNPEESK